MFVGIYPGESRRASAGARRRLCTLAVSEDGQVVTIGDRRFSVSDDMLVFWHQDDAGTFYGVRSAEDLRTMRAENAPWLHPGEDIPGRELTSSSGAADIAALVVKVTRPIAIVTSGYRGRNESYLIVEPNGEGGLRSERVIPADYRGRFAPIETL